MTKISRQAYAEMFGPTTGDRVRLGDTELWIEVERDFTTYGEEVKFGGGKVIRDGMGQSQRTSVHAVDAVITNALIIDHTGIIKADVGIKEGRIAAIGKAGNPDIQPSVDIIIGPGTEVIAGEGPTSILHDRERLGEEILQDIPEGLKELLLELVDLERQAFPVGGVLGLPLFLTQLGDLGPQVRCLGLDVLPELVGLGPELVVGE
jgi:hypothetical protein